MYIFVYVCTYVGICTYKKNMKVCMRLHMHVYAFMCIRMYRPLGQVRRVSGLGPRVSGVRASRKSTLRRNMENGTKGASIMTNTF